ncbi:MAG: hypothetical protein GXC75_04255 [Xanthomonadaceae bacterium]|nr:hypothetical protein [Xanthomonadaceae bacterium]
MEWAGLDRGSRRQTAYLLFSTTCQEHKVPSRSSIARVVMWGCLLFVATVLHPTVASAGSLPDQDRREAFGVRPKTCLVLGGGGARGAAHIGLLKVLERERVPVDCIVGTSMGAIVGGLYASGYNADEIESILEAIDWNAVLHDRPPRDERSMRRKEDDLRRLGGFELGVHGGKIAVPRGMIQGQQLEMLLRRLLLPVGQVHDFDDLPIPFRAVATDIVKGEKVVFGEGDLVVALRASMSVPGIFAPVSVDGRLLVDGGVLDNVPVDEARLLGGRRLIVSRVGSPLMTEEQLDSPLAITHQMANILMRHEVEAQLATLSDQDILLAPELGDIASEQFNRSPEAVLPGLRAAEALAPDLRRFGVDERHYAAFKARHRLPDVETQTLRFARVEKDHTRTSGYVEKRLVPLLGQPLEVAPLEAALANAYGEGRYEKLGWTLDRREDSWGLRITPIDKAWGPDFLHFTLRLSDDFEGASNYQLVTEWTRTGLTDDGAEARLRLGIGEQTQVFGEFYRPFGASASQAWSVYLQYLAADRQLPTIERVPLAEYRHSQWLGGARWAYSPHRNWEMSGDLERGQEQLRLRVGDESLLGNYRANLGSVGLQLRYDAIDSAAFPSRGHRLTLNYRRYDQMLGSSEDAGVTRLQWDGAWSHGEHRWLGGIRAATSTGSDGLLAAYGFLGGMGNLSGYPEQSIFAPHTGLARMVYYRRVLHSDSLLTVPLYVGGSAELGGFWAQRDQADFDDLMAAGSIFFGADSPLGPIFLGYGRAESGRDAFYLTFGSMLRALDGF